MKKIIAGILLVLSFQLFGYEEKINIELKNGKESVVMNESEIPDGFRNYLDGVKESNVEIIMQGFSDKPIVIDVGRKIIGKEAIKKWLIDEVLGLKYSVLKVTQKKESTVVLVEITLQGGSKFKANYDLKLDSKNKIVMADLTYAN